MSPELCFLSVGLGASVSQPPGGCELAKGLPGVRPRAPVFHSALLGALGECASPGVPARVCQPMCASPRVSSPRVCQPVCV